MLPNLICHLIRRTVKRHTHIYIISAIATLVTLLAACGPQGNDFRLEGSFRDMQAGELYVYNLEGRDAKFDTLTIQEGRFLYKGQVTTTTPFILLFPNGVEQVIFVSPGADLAYEATANDLKNYVVNGTDENKLMNKFRREATKLLFRPWHVLISTNTQSRLWPYICSTAILSRVAVRRSTFWLLS